MLHCFFSRQQAGAAANLNASFPSYTLLSGPPRRWNPVILYHRAPTFVIQSFQWSSHQGMHALFDWICDSGKTSLLLQFAYNCARSESATAVFICKRQNVERKPPILSEDADASSEVFERVHMKYVDDDDGIRKYFAAFHLHDRIPKVVIIDDFFELFDDWKCKKLYGQLRGREIGIIRTLALCRDAIDHATKTCGAECKLLISDTHANQGPGLLYIYQRWLSTILTIEALDSRFMLKTYRNDGSSQGDKAYAQYTMAQQNLKLEMLG